MRVSGNKLYVFCLFLVFCFCGAVITVEDEDIPELQFVNTAVDPCDDFFEYACGNFEKIHPLGKEKVVDEFTILTNKILKSMIKILNNSNSTYDSEALKKVQTAFKSCLNLKISDSRRPFPEIIFLDEVGGMPMFKTPKTSPPFGWNDIGQLTAEYGVSLFFKMTVIPFPISATDNLLRIEQDDLSNYLTELEGDNTPFDIFLRKVFTILRDHINVDVTNDDIEKGIGEIIKFMENIQNNAGIPDGTNITSLTTTTVLKDLQDWTDEQFDGKAPINWTEYLDAAFSEAGVKMSNNTNVYVNSTYVYNVLNVVRNTRQDIVRNFVLMRILLFSAMDSHMQIRKALEEYYMVKNFKLFPREEYCVRQLIDIDSSDAVVGLSLASGKLFADNDNGKTRLLQATNMIRDLARTFLDSVVHSQWMDVSSKAGAVKKTQNMIALIGLPDFVKNKTLLDEMYKNLKIEKWDSYGNNQRLRAFKQAYMFSQLGKPRNRAHWDRSPFETNAYYNRANNKITIPFAMMNPLFFDGKVKLMDYSHLGALVGHEITHGFDNTGRQYDENGTMNDMWTDVTLKAYQEKIECFKEQYSRYFIGELNRTLDGTRSLNENLADNGGARISYKAARKFFNTTRLESDRFTAEQLFFIGFGTTFCSTETNQYLEYTLSKGYSPSKYRIIGALSNMEEFSRAFSCPRGSKMNPVKKCTLW